jgi:methionine-rich copper-binding protein CopC
MKTNSKLVFSGLVRLGILSALALALTLPREAQAHAKLLRSSPPDKGELATAPKQIELWFSELLDDKFNSIEVYSSAELSAKTHTALTEGEAKVDPKDRTHLTVTLKGLAPGEYTVDWRVLSMDGHSAPGRFSFKVAEPKK